MEAINPFKKFLALVQAQTAVISILPFIIGSLFAYYYYQNINIGDDLLLILAVISFHFAVNGHNQYTDYFRYQKSQAQNSYNNILLRFKIKLSLSKIIIVALTIFSAAIGIYLSIKTGWPLLVIGIVSFLVGFCYSGGPFPILKTPFGELASGLTMGYNITLLGIYINIYNLPYFDSYFWLKGLLVAIPAIFLISDVMLANNICDVKEDIEIGRKTIVYYLGRKKALKMLIITYILSYLGIIAGTLFKLIPLISLFSLLTIPIVYSRLKIFINKPQKATTFPNVLISLQIILFSEIILLLIGSII